MRSERSLLGERDEIHLSERIVLQGSGHAVITSEALRKKWKSLDSTRLTVDLCKHGEELKEFGCQETSLKQFCLA